MQSFEAQIENLAGVLVLLDSSNIPALAILQSQFESLAESMWKEHPQLTAISRKCAALTTKLIMCEIKDVDSVLSTLDKGIAGMQAVIRDHLQPDWTYSNLKMWSAEETKAGMSVQEEFTRYERYRKYS